MQEDSVQPRAPEIYRVHFVGEGEGMSQWKIIDSNSIRVFNISAIGATISNEKKSFDRVPESSSSFCKHRCKVTAGD